MYDKDSFLIEQAYMKVVKSQTVNENHPPSEDWDLDWETLFWKYFDTDEPELRQELVQLAQERGVESAEQQSSKDLYDNIPGPDHEVLHHITEMLRMARKEDEQAQRDVRDTEETESSLRGQL